MVHPVSRVSRRVTRFVLEHCTTSLCLTHVPLRGDEFVDDRRNTSRHACGAALSLMFASGSLALVFRYSWDSLYCVLPCLVLYSLCTLKVLVTSDLPQHYACRLSGSHELDNFRGNIFLVIKVVRLGGVPISSGLLLSACKECK